MSGLGAALSGGTPTSKAAGVPPETAEQLLVTREALWRVARALNVLIHAAAGRRDLARFEIALEEGAAALAALPRFAS